jgi:hypothetical protein
MDPDNLNPPAPAPEPAPAPPAPAPEPAPAPPADEETPAPAPADDEPPRDDKGRFQKRVDDLTRARGEAEREASYWRAQALGTKGTPSPAPLPAAADAPPKPTAAEFDNFEDFVEALAGWKANEVDRANREQSRKAEHAKSVATSWQQREAEFRKTATDYVDVVGNSDVVLPEYVLEGLQESDVGPQLAYHLAKNHDVAEKLRGLPERAAMRELGRLEASIASAPAPAPAPAARTTNAPPPVKPVSQGNAVVPTLDKMSMDDYVKARKGQGAGWAR